jgi:hypothetical protein
VRIRKTIQSSPSFLSLIGKADIISLFFSRNIDNDREYISPLLVSFHLLEILSKMF